MVRTRPTNKLRKISHGTSIDLTDATSTSKAKARQKIVMEDDAPTPPRQNQGSPTSLEAALIENLAAGDKTPNLFKALGSPQAEERAAQTPSGRQASGGEKEKPSSSSKPKHKGDSASSAKTPVSSSRTNPPPEPEEEEVKEVSHEASSSEIGDSGEEEEQEPPPKRARV